MVTIQSPTADHIMDALGHQTRRDILTLLKGNPMPVGTLAAHLPISRPAVSKHLRILQNAGLVEYESSGTRNIFRLRSSGFQVARAYLEEFWDQALTNFKTIAENLDETEE